MSKGGKNTADIAEAQECISKAEKKLKTSLFQWKPNYLEAAEEYQKAAELYARSVARPDACCAWRKASEAFQKANCDVEAANCLEKMASFLTGKYESALASQSPGEVSETLREVLAALEESSRLLRAERPTRSIDMLHRLVDVVEGVLRKDTLQKAPLTNPLAFVPPTPLYEIYVKGVHLLLSVYHSLYDIVDLHPHRVPVVCRSEIQYHLRCGQLDRAIATEKHLLGNVLPSVVELAQQPTVRVFPSNLVSSPLLSEKSGGEKTKHHAHPSGSSGTSQTANSSTLTTTPTALVEETKLSQQCGIYDEKYNVYKRLNQPSNAAKAALEIVILAIKAEEPHIGPANNIFQPLCRVYGFKDSPEQHFAASLLSAMEQQNDEQVEEVIKGDACFNFLMASISQIVMGFLRKKPRDVKEKHSSNAVGAQPDGAFLSAKVDTTSAVPRLSSNGSVDHSTSLPVIFKPTFVEGKNRTPPLPPAERQWDVGTVKTSSPFILTVASSTSSSPSSTSFVEQTLPTPPWKGGNENEIDSEASQRGWSLLQDGQEDLSPPQAGSHATDSCISLDLPYTATIEGPASVNLAYSTHSSPPSHRVISVNPRYLSAPEDNVMTPPPPPEAGDYRTFFPTEGDADGRTAEHGGGRSAENESDIVPTSLPPVNDGSSLSTAEEATLEDLLL